MEQASINLPLEYWRKRKQFLKAARYRFLFGKVRMVKKKDHCEMVFYHNTSLFYLVNASIDLGAWMKSKGYRTWHNPMEY